MAEVSSREGGKAATLVGESKGKKEPLLPKILSAGITLLGALYLVAVPLGWIRDNRFGTTEAVVFVSLLFFNSVLVTRLERFSFSGKGVEFQLQQVREEQRKQQAEISSLKFLISYFVSESELIHLKKLAGKVESKFNVKDEWDQNILRDELRRLRSLGLIAMIANWWIAQIPRQGDLTEYCRITDRGLEYLRLRDEVQAEQKADNG
ncbi:MAG: hypothetical protein JF614_31410 [Acidobacteria bacterium]|nr:hypothetical protein [Acidobacteriota bacterium]